jgi:predicted HD phosphohydrolase
VTIDELFAVLAEGERFTDGEELDALAHHLQCAAILAEEAPDDIELQIAGLVHDVGSQLAPGSCEAHGAIGARAVRPLLGERVATLVRGHVAAKRYLVATDPGYRALLSENSLYTLSVQGDALDDRAIARLDAHPDRDAVLHLRRADDRAKVAGLSVPGLDQWRTTAEAVARSYVGSR